MNFLSFNIRGTRDPDKARYTKHLVSHHKLHFVGLQETLKSDGSQLIIRNFWGNYPAEQEWVNSNGRSGGLLSIWDPSVFIKNEVIKSQNLLLISGTLRGFDVILNIANIYSPQDLPSKRSLWSQIETLKAEKQGFWIILGDFNCVRSPDERLNSEFCNTSALAFNDFIHRNDLHEFPMLGSPFTYISGDGTKKSRIDRILVCSDFFCKWSDASFRCSHNTHSDHFALILKTDSFDFGPHPFRFFNSWLDHEGIDDVVKSALSSHGFYGNPDRILLQKLKHTKNKLKDWIKSIRRDDDLKIEELSTFIEHLDSVSDHRALTETETKERFDAKEALQKLRKSKLLDLKQKSRYKWILQGDENTSFFHRFIKCRSAKSRINGLEINNQWCRDPDMIKAEIRSFFSSKFLEPVANRPSFHCYNINKICESDSAVLTAPFSLLEIKAAVWDCGSDKAPGPDGFNFTFIKRFWEQLQFDFLNILISFYHSGTISEGCGSCFIALIPKNNTPSSPQDFRPITLINCVRKVISKVLANRLKKVIHKIISPSQSAFVTNRNILDGPLIVNEIISWLKRSKLEGFLFKIDFEKAFDTLNWSFLFSILTQMCFPSRWISWIQGLLQSTSTSVLVNGSPTDQFQCFRGIPQGDPLSPFLFIIVMEGFVSMISKACSVGLIRGLKLPNNGPLLSNLLFADDVLLFGSWSESSINNISRLLRCFFLASGLKVNMSKSSLLGVGVPENRLTAVAQNINCTTGSLPFTYLGIPVGANMNLIKNWRPILNLFEKRLALWKANTLSFGGRITLLRSVLDSLPTYFFSLFKAPVAVLNSLEALRRRFFWAGTLKNGRAIKFWLDSWLQATPLRTLFPDLFAIERVKNCSVADRCPPNHSSIHWNWSWSSPISSSREVNQLVQLSEMLRNVQLQEENDAWSWSLDESGLYTVKSVRKVLSNAYFGPSPWVFPWNKIIPLNVNVFAWRAELDRIATKKALAARSINLENLLCPFCNEFEESINHILIHCSLASTVWYGISSWLKIQPIFAFEIRDLFEFHKKPQPLAVLIIFAVQKKKTNAAYYAIPLTSVMFVGHLGDVELAASNLANSWANVTGFSFMIGLSGALETLCGQGFGAKVYIMLGIYLQASCLISIFFSILISIFWFFTEPILILLQQDPQISKMAALYIKYLIPGLFAYGMLQNMLRFLQTQSIVYPLVWCSLVPFFVHLGFNYVLVYYTSLGFIGSPLAVSGSFCFSAVLLAGYVVFTGRFKETWRGFSIEAFGYVVVGLKLALPSAAMICLEYWAFELLVLLAGLLPNSEITTSLIAMCVNTQDTCYNFMYGLGAAVSTRVSNELGARDINRAKHAMVVSLQLSVILAIALVSALGFGHDIWASLFSDSPVIIHEYASITPLFLISIMIDSIQGILSGVARGCGWQHLAVYINLAMFYLIGMPIAIALAFLVKLYAKGLWIGLICGLSSQTGALLLLVYLNRWTRVDLNDDNI